jgi:hypothetical protein
MATTTIVRQQLRRAPDAVAEMLACPDDLEPLVNDLATMSGVVVSGRGRRGLIRRDPHGVPVDRGRGEAQHSAR